MLELTVVLKDDERTYRKKTLVYEDVFLSETQEDATITKAIKEAKEDFKGEPDEIQIKIHLQVR